MKKGDSKTDLKKAASMREKTTKVRRMFNLPESEDRIQNYACSLGIHRVELYITQNYACYANDAGRHAEKVPFRKVTEISPSGKTKILIKEDKEHLLRVLVHRNEALNLMIHLWKHPPNMILLEDEPEARKSLLDELAENESGEDTQAPNGNGAASPQQQKKGAPSGPGSGIVNGGGGSNTSTPTTGRKAESLYVARLSEPASGKTPNGRPSSVMGAGSVWGGGGGGGVSDGGAGAKASPTPERRGWGSWGDDDSDDEFGEGPSGGPGLSLFGGGGGGQQQKTLSVADVDVASTERMLAEAYMAQNIMGDTLDVMEAQGEQIDRIHAKVFEINNHLNKADRQMRSIESLAGYAFNKTFGPRKDKHYKGESREIMWQKKKTEKVEIPILMKKKNDDLAPAMLIFEENNFSCKLDGTKKESKQLRWTYDSVDKVVIRSRPLHLDIKFLSDRFRLASSYIQAIVNELYIRARGSTVIFDAETRKFGYGSSAIVMAPKSRKEPGASPSFFGVKKQTSDLLSDGVGEDVKEAVRKQEDNLDALGRVVGTLHSMAAAAGTEMDRQNEHLDELTDDVHKLNERMHNAVNRIERKL